MKDSFSSEEIGNISNTAGVASVMSLGACLIVELSRGNNVSAISDILLEDRVYVRAVGPNKLYVMPSLFATTSERQRLVRVLKSCLTKIYYTQKKVSP
jgi:adenosylmethionine-8-amino-7-oxononanoate aminotransferase